MPMQRKILNLMLHLCFCVYGAFWLQNTRKLQLQGVRCISDVLLFFEKKYQANNELDRSLTGIMYTVIDVTVYF